MTPDEAMEYLKRGGRITIKKEPPCPFYFQMFRGGIIMRVTPVTSCAAEVKPEFMFSTKEQWDYWTKYHEWIAYE